MLTAVTNYFVGDPHLSTSESYRARLLISSSLVSATLISPFAIAWGLRSDWFGMQFLLLLTLSITLVTTPFIFKISRSIKFSGIYVNFISTLVIIIFTFFDGGLYSTSLPMFPVLPLFAVFYSGRTYGFFICIALLLYLVLLLFLHDLNVVPVAELSGSELLAFHAGSTISATIILLVVAFNYLAWQSVLREELLKAGRAKNEFLSGVSHELRTPLNSILGFSDVLQRSYVGELNGKQQEYVSNIHASGDHLLQLVNDLLDITKIESGKIDFQPEPSDMIIICDEVKAMITESASSKNITLKTVTNELNDQLFVIDQLKIKQVLLNLLNNAVKFTPAEGTVTLKIFVENDVLLISVEDTGPGIPIEYQHTIFERFFQVHHSNDDKDPGTGLGLAISKHFIELHGGSIYLRNDSQGAKFVCEIPV